MQRHHAACRCAARRHGGAGANAATRQGCMRSALIIACLLERRSGVVQHQRRADGRPRRAAVGREWCSAITCAAHAAHHRGASTVEEGTLAYPPRQCIAPACAATTAAIATATATALASSSAGGRPVPFVDGRDASSGSRPTDRVGTAASATTTTTPPSTVSSRRRAGRTTPARAGLVDDSGPARFRRVAACCWKGRRVSVSVCGRRVGRWDEPADWLSASVAKYRLAVDAIGSRGRLARRLGRFAVDAAPVAPRRYGVRHRAGRPVSLSVMDASRRACCSRCTRLYFDAPGPR